MLQQLAINGGEPCGSAKDLIFSWPRITEEAEKSITNQLYESISIYNKSGVIKKFEDSFKQYHNCDFGLLSNSGTSAIFSMFEAINLEQGDEIICPVYTFHATISPVVYTGAIPIFCDSDEQGNITIKEVKAKFSYKTKAVILTHMWGMPIKDIEAIAEFCKKKKIWLLEDCSHAHGAKLNGKNVGTFGDMAAWSLQGQKTITGGEGGIMLTNNATLYSRALIQGHYNKRPYQELEDSDANKAYSLTGLGLKLRSHPLAVALALQQFQQLDKFIDQRNIYATMFDKAISKYMFLKSPGLKDNARSSWYAYNINYLADKSYGVTREEFVEALHAEGLVEADIPGSTMLLNNLPLFLTPNAIMPRMYSEPLKHQEGFPKAEQFYNSIIKFPMWTFKDELKIVEAYIAGIIKVADYLEKYKTLKRVDPDAK